MKKKLLLASLFVLFNQVYAADFTDIARVISSVPIYERVNEPHRECSTDTVQYAPQERSIGGSLIGGIAGGLLGNQIGGGHGNTAATAAGAIAGAIVGDRVANSNQPGSQQVQHCRDIDSYHDVIKGYTVTYRYKGQQATTTLPYQPGDTVQVGVSLIQEPQHSYRDNRQYDQNTDYRSGNRY